MAAASAAIAPVATASAAIASVAIASAAIVAIASAALVAIASAAPATASVVAIASAAMALAVSASVAASVCCVSATVDGICCQPFVLLLLFLPRHPILVFGVVRGDGAALDFNSAHKILDAVIVQIPDVILVLFAPAKMHEQLVPRVLLGLPALAPMSFFGPHVVAACV